jgi:8-oxo-dGTP pyrophosphatase MutT (NUDIX family)
LVKQTNGFVSFPKGHVENNETEEETALRECLEETGLKVNIKKGFREVVNYYIPEIDVNKDVVLFVGEIDNLDYHRQEKEIDDIKVCKYQEAYNLLQFDNWKNALKKANDFLKTII